MTPPRKPTTDRATITIKGVPRKLKASWEQRAKQERRSLTAWMIHTLESAVTQP